MARPTTTTKSPRPQVGTRRQLPFLRTVVATRVVVAATQHPECELATDARRACQCAACTLRTVEPMCHMIHRCVNLALLDLATLMIQPGTRVRVIMSIQRSAVTPRQGRGVRKLTCVREAVCCDVVHRTRMYIYSRVQERCPLNSALAPET